MFFTKAKPKEPPPVPVPTANPEDYQGLTENLYKRNLELAVKNKTLSLLGKLYEISILALPPAELSDKLVHAIRDGLEFERVGVILYDSEHDQLSTLAFAESERFHTARAGESSPLVPDKPDASKNPFYHQAVAGKKMAYTENLTEARSPGVPDSVIEKLVSDGHVRSFSAYPLIIEDKVIGLFTLSLNRVYADLSPYEKEAIGNIVNVIAVALDKALIYEQLNVTNKKLAEANDRLKELDQMKSEFLSIASHQLRAPLTAIRGYASVITEGDYGPVPETFKEPLSRIIESARNMVNSIEDYLNISRIEQGRMKFESAPIDLVDLSKKVTEEMQPVAGHRGLTLTFAENPTPTTVVGDVGKIKQVITNLVDNAIKYTEKGGVTVAVSQEGKNARITITDTGIGISKEDIGQLFEKFKRARDANKVNTTGTGLGLYVAKQLIEGHKGKVWVESDGPGKGSRFIIELPL